MQTLRQIGITALGRLLNSSRFRPSDPETDHRVVFSENDFDLEKILFEEDVKDHDTGYHVDTTYMIWGIELGLVTLTVFETGYEIHHAIITHAVPTSMSALPSHVIVYNRSDSDHDSPSSIYTVYRLSDKQDELLRQLRDCQPAPEPQP